MASTEAATDSSGPRYAPDDPTLPAPWKGLIDGSTLYYWNPDTNETQYERPAAAAPPLPTGPPPVTSTPMPTSASGAFAQPSMQLKQVGQVSQQERPGQAAYPQASHLGQQQHQQSTQQPPFQPTAQHQPPFQHSQQAPYQQQQQMSQQPPAHQYPNTHPQHMPYQHGHYMQPQQQQQQQNQIPQGPQYSYQIGQQPHMPQTAYNQGQQPPISQASYNQSQQPTQAAGAYNQGQQPPVSQVAYNQSQQPTQAAGAYNQGQQPPMPQASYNQVQQPQMPHTSYNQGQQPQGMRIPQGQQPQQSLGFHQPAQVSQLLQASQSQGLQMASQQGQLQHGFPFSPPQGKQPYHDHVGPQLSQVPLGQQSSTLKVDETGVTAGGPSYSAKHHLGGSSPGETNNMNFLSPPAQIHQGGMDVNYRQQAASGHAPNHLGPSPVRPPMGFKMGSSEDHFERNELHSSGRMDGTNSIQQQPKLAALPAINRPDMRNGPPYPQPDNLGVFNMRPPHSVPNLHNHGQFPEASMMPPSRMFSAPNFPSITSADAYRQHHEVTAVGENVPPPFMTFEATGFPPEILREIHAAGFLNPTPIQAQTWPVALQNRDIVAIAKTGSGKTLGYLIPAFIHLRRCQNNPMLGPTVLILAPTRELASQIQDEAIKFGRSSRISCTCLYGGTSKGPQLRELERGADIVIATPGRLNDILEMRKISLHQVSLLVLDEADRMLDMGFEPQIRKVVEEIPRNRQTLMYTATWPKEVTKIAGDLLRDPVKVNIGSIDELVANKSITQYVEVIPPFDKQRRLEQILRAQERGSKVIIFCSTKKLCDQLSRDIDRSFGAASIHGDKSQAERDNVLNQFRTGRAPILVATDVAARGLDIKDIRVVINYDFPTGIEDYVHRIGRTGRAGATGVSYTFFSEQDWKYAGDLVKVLEGANQHVPLELHEMAARGATGPPRNQAGGMSRWDGPGGGGNRFEPAVGVPAMVELGMAQVALLVGMVQQVDLVVGMVQHVDLVVGMALEALLVGRFLLALVVGRVQLAWVVGRVLVALVDGVLVHLKDGKVLLLVALVEEEVVDLVVLVVEVEQVLVDLVVVVAGVILLVLVDVAGVIFLALVAVAGVILLGLVDEVVVISLVDVVGEAMDLEGADDPTEAHMTVLSQMDVEDTITVEVLVAKVGTRATAVAQTEAAREAMTEEVTEQKPKQELVTEQEPQLEPEPEPQSQPQPYRSRSHDQGAGPARRTRPRSGFDVLPPATAAGPSLTIPGPVAVQAPRSIAPVSAQVPAQSLADTSAMSPMSPGGLAQEGAQGEQLPIQGAGAAMQPNFSAAEAFPGQGIQQDAPDV
uniref:RNA helicase n=1 Tax=Leersia perrieri TaxID=77586 RepID=A0A0D9XVG5_9ORYZ